MPPPRFPIPQGTLDMLILQILSLEAANGWLPARWRQSETGREVKLCSPAPAGRRRLAAEQHSWARLSGAVNLIFQEGSR